MDCNYFIVYSSSLSSFHLSYLFSINYAYFWSFRKIFLTFVFSLFNFFATSRFFLKIVISLILFPTLYNIRKFLSCRCSISVNCDSGTYKRVRNDGCQRGIGKPENKTQKINLLGRKNRLKCYQFAESSCFYFRYLYIQTKHTPFNI